MDFQTIRHTVRGATAHIVFNRPERQNAMTSQMYAEIRDAVRLSDLDDTVDSILFTGTDGSFAVGGDLDEGRRLVQNANEDPLALYSFEDRLPFYTIANSDKITISAINGTCVGGGLIIALCTDFLVAASSAVLGVPEGKAGMAEPWSPQLLYGRVSLTDVKYLVLTGELITADEAGRIRLVNSVVDDEDLFGEVETILSKVRKLDPSARSAYKAYLRDFTEIAPPVAASDALRRIRDGERS